MNKITTSLTAIALAAGFSLAAIAPASADQAAVNRNEIIGGLALVAGIATAINVSNKNAEAQRENDYYYNNGYGYDRGNDRGFRGNDGRNYRVDRDNNGGNRRDTQRGWQR